MLASVSAATVVTRWGGDMTELALIVLLSRRGGSLDLGSLDFLITVVVLIGVMLVALGVPSEVFRRIDRYLTTPEDSEQPPGDVAQDAPVRHESSPLGGDQSEVATDAFIGWDDDGARIHRGDDRGGDGQGRSARLRRE